jgi:zinc transport system permease protein
MPDFLVNALIAGTVIALMAGPLGCFVVWRRMAYFGAALAHSALLGVALALLAGGLLIDMSATTSSMSYRTGMTLIQEPTPVVLLLCLLLALVLLWLQHRHLLASDTLLGIVAHGTLALGLLIVATMDHLRIDLMAYLFGDILSIGVLELAGIVLVSSAVIAVLALNWRSLLSSTINQELAAVEGVRTVRVEMILVLMLGCVVALGMRMVGILLIISMLIIPPATARRMASTPKQMAIGAAAIGVIDVWAGLYVSWHLDLPAGPAIVAVSTLIFASVMLWPKAT